MESKVVAVRLPGELYESIQKKVGSKGSVGSYIRDLAMRDDERLEVTRKERHRPIGDITQEEITPGSFGVDEGDPSVRGGGDLND